MTAHTEALDVVTDITARVKLANPDATKQDFLDAIREGLVAANVRQQQDSESPLSEIERVLDDLAAGPRAISVRAPAGVEVYRKLKPFLASEDEDLMRDANRLRFRVLTECLDLDAEHAAKVCGLMKEVKP